jgi:hypothetical protein
MKQQVERYTMSEKDKTIYHVEARVETIAVLPRTLTIKPETMKLGAGIDSTMYVVYGQDAADRRVWLATFIDEQEAESWVMASKTFGRPVTGAVLAGQGNLVKGAEMSDDVTEAPSTETPN